MNKISKLLFAAWLAICCVAVANAENSLTVFDSTQVSPYVPLPTASYNEAGTRGQVIYPAEVLTAMVGQPINGFTLYVYDEEGCKMNGGTLRVSMGEVEETVFSGTSFYSGLTAVAFVEMRKGLHEIDFDFDTPYIYNGGNLVIDFYVQKGGESGAYNFTYFYGLFQQGHTSLTTGDEGNEYREFIPKTTFSYGELEAYSAKVNPRYVDFNTVRAGQSDTATVVLRNNGQNAFTPTVSADAPFRGSIPAGVTLQPGETMEVAVMFEPTQAGDFQGNLYINCGQAGTLEVPLTGTALENGQEFTVCDGDARNQYVPFNGIYADDVNTLGQMIYPADKLTTIKDGKIVALSFFTTSRINMRNVVLQLSMQETEQVEFEQAVPMTGLDAVATANVVYGDTIITFELDAPFEYTGGNLALEVKVVSTGWTATTFFLGEATDNYASLSCYKSWSGDKKDRYQFLPMATFTYKKEGAPQGIRGDVNDDNLVNINDVTALINYLLSKNATGINLDNADCDLNHNVNINDVTTLINYLLSKKWND